MLDERTARRFAERQLVRELFTLDIPLEKKIEIHTKFRREFRPSVPHSSESILIFFWEDLGLLPVGSWKKHCAKVNNDRRKGFDTPKRHKLKQEHSCERCGSDKDLIVHHKVSIACGGTHDIENLVVLCKNCHRRVHSNRCMCDFEKFFLCKREGCPDPYDYIFLPKKKRPPKCY